VKRGKEAFQVIVDELPERHVIMTIGKGGVGKTTVSILFSLMLSQRGKTLLASLDPAKHLLEYLSLPKVLKEVDISDTLKIVQYDIDPLAKKVSEEYAALLRQVAPGLRILGLDDMVNAVRHAPGFEEEIFLRILESLYERKDLNYVVIDTPPTGITRRIFNLPRLYLFWLERLFDIRSKIVSLRYTIARSLGEKAPESDPVLNKLKTLRDRYSELLSKMRAPNFTSIIIVTTPEPLPVYEAEEMVRFLRELEMPVRALIINKVLPTDIAKRLATLESQEDNIKKVLNINCGSCRKLMIRHHSKTPRTLDEARELLDLAELLS